MTELEMGRAIDRLTALFEYGALLAATNPPEFMNQIADEIERLRCQNLVMLRLLKEASEGKFPHVTTSAWLLETLDIIAKAEGRRE